MARKPVLKPLLVVLGLAAAAAVGVDVYRGLAGLPPPKRPNFGGTDLKGKTFSLAEHRGKRPVLLSFFSLSCGPCRMEYPHLVDLQEKYRSRGLEVVLLGEDRPEQILADETYGRAPFTILPNATQIEAQYRIEALPHLVYFEPDGTVGEDIEGFGEGVLEPIIRRLERAPMTQ